MTGHRDPTAVLAEAMRSAGSRGAIWFLTGEPGIGKTHVLERVAVAAAGLGVNGCRGAAREGAWQPPFSLWTDALGQDVAADASVDAAGLPPDEARYRAAGLVRGRLASLAAQGPTAVLLDDLHWADRESLAILGVLADAIVDLGIVLVGAHRPASRRHAPALDELLTALRRVEGFHVLEVAPLDRDGIEALAATLGVAGSPADLDEIERVTGGNPLYARELLRHDRDAAATTSSAVVPASVRDLVRGRLAELAPDTRAALPVLALLASPFTFTTLAAVSSLDEAGAIAMVDDALASGLLRVTRLGDGAGYELEHDIVRHALADDPNPARVAARHRAIADALLALHGDRAIDHAAEIVHHLYEASSLPGGEHGIELCLAAAGRARRAGAAEQAVELLRMGVALAAAGPPRVRAQVRCELAVAEAEALHLDTAVDATHDAAAALASSAPPIDLVRFLARAARALKDVGAPAGVWLPLVEQGLARCGDHHDVDWARLAVIPDPTEPLHVGTLWAARWRGYDPTAIDLLTEHGDELDTIHVLQPYDWTTRAETDALIARARTWSHPAAVLRAFNAAGRSLLFRHGDIAAADACLAECADTASRSGSVTGEADARAQRAICLGLLGDLDRADASLARARELVDQIGPEHRARFVVEVLAASYVAFLRGEGPFLAWAEAAARVVTDPSAGTNVTAPSLAGFAVWTSAFGGDPATALALLDDLVPMMEQLPSRDYTLNGLVTVCARAVWELQDEGHAARLLAVSDRVMGDGVVASPGGPLSASAALLASLVHDTDRAFALLADARASLHDAPLPTVSTILAADEARILRRAEGDTPAVRAMTARAIDGFRARGQHGWVARLENGTTPARGAPAVGAPAATPAPAPDGLSRREVEVLCRLAAGRTNKQIAADLYVSPATAQRHVANIYLKIGASNRAEATSYAHRHGLV